MPEDPVRPATGISGSLPGLLHQFGYACHAKEAQSACNTQKLPATWPKAHATNNKCPAKLLPGLYLAEGVLRPTIHLAAAKHVVYCHGIGKIELVFTACQTECLQPGCLQNASCNMFCCTVT